MQIVIDIPENMYDGIINNRRPLGCIAEMLDAIKDGTPLPEGHGRLIDADALWKKWVFDAIGKQEIDDAPTIIEADKNEEMTREEAIRLLDLNREYLKNTNSIGLKDDIEALDMAIKVLEEKQNIHDKCKRCVEFSEFEQKPCEDAISRQAVLDAMSDTWKHICSVARRKHPTKGEKAVYSDLWNTVRQVLLVTPQPKINHCKDCKWWKDSDGIFRRGIGAESQCPMNRIEVFEGNGYCYMFESQKSEDKE